jgi:hypothetical protein
VDQPSSGSSTESETDHTMSSAAATTAVAVWTREEDKTFENAVAKATAPPADGPPDESWFSALAASLPLRTAEEVRRHYEALLQDVGDIEAGRVPLPRYAGEDSATLSEGAAAASSSKDGGGNRRDERRGGADSGKSCSNSKAEQERRKGIPWTEEEHR